MVIRIFSPIIMADVACIHTGEQRTIHAIHENQCPSLIQLADCTCENVTYRMVTTRNAAAQR